MTYGTKREVSGWIQGWGDRRWNLRLWLGGTTCSMWKTSRRCPEAGAEEGLNSIWPFLCWCYRLALALLWKTIYTSPGMYLLCWLCVDEEDGCALGHTRDSCSAIKSRWSCGIKLVCNECYQGSWYLQSGTARFGCCCIIKICFGHHIGCVGLIMFFFFFLIWLLCLISHLTLVLS